MGLETILQPEGINIKDFAATEPRKLDSGPFDPERELSDFDKRRLLQFVLKSIPRQQTSGRHIAIFEDIAALKMLLPSLYPEESISEELRLRHKEWFSDAETFHPMDSEKVAHHKILFPNDPIPIEHTNEFNTAVRNQIQMQRGALFGVVGTMAISSLEDLAILTNNPHLLSEKEWEDYKRYFSFGKHSSIRRFALYARYARTLFPEHFDSLTFPPDFWKRAREILDTELANADEDLGALRFALNLKILAAEEVKITNKGVELIMPKPREEKTEAIPEPPNVRKF